jgi:hypothetical protein
MSKIIAITGYAQSGKDEVAKVLVERHKFVRISFAEPIRTALLTLNPYIKDNLRVSDILDSIGYEAAKRQYPEYRRLLQVFGTEVAREQWKDSFWVDLAFDQMDPEKDYVIPDCRFPNEADAVLAHGGEIWRVKRPGVGPVNAHASDNLIETIGADVILNNEGTLAELYQDAIAAYDSIMVY